MKDFLFRGLVPTLNARFAYALTTVTVTDVVLAHDCDPPAAHLLGRALNAAALSIPFFKGDQRATIRWQYRGAIQSILVDFGADGGLRGRINPPRLLDLAEDTAALYGDLCQLSVTRSDPRRVLSSGTSSCILKDVVADLEFYYCTSDQIETGMVSMIAFNPDPEQPIQLSQGFLIQAMPGCDLEVFDKARQRMNHAEVRDLLAHMPPNDEYLKQILVAVTGNPDAVGEICVQEEPRPHFSCNCDEERLATVVRTLTPEDRRDILAANEDLRIRCSFCNKLHVITPEQFKLIHSGIS